MGKRHVSSFVCNRIVAAFLRRRDVVALALLRPATNQDHEAFPILTEIDAIARAEINLLFKDATADAPGIGQFSLFHARKSNRDLGGRSRIQALKHLAKRCLPVSST
jgi:hypothetical protein